MRHITWAVTWLLVGLGITLGTASLLMERATVQRIASPSVAPSPAAAATTDAKVKTGEPQHSLIVASRRHRAVD